MAEKVCRFGAFLASAVAPRGRSRGWLHTLLVALAVVFESSGTALAYEACPDGPSRPAQRCVMGVTLASMCQEVLDGFPEAQCEFEPLGDSGLALIRAREDRFDLSEVVELVEGVPAEFRQLAHLGVAGSPGIGRHFEDVLVSTPRHINRDALVVDITHSVSDVDADYEYEHTMDSMVVCHLRPSLRCSAPIPRAATTIETWVIGDGEPLEAHHADQVIRPGDPGVELLAPPRSALAKRPRLRRTRRSAAYIVPRRDGSIRVSLRSGLWAHLGLYPLAEGMDERHIIIPATS